MRLADFLDELKPLRVVGDVSVVDLTGVCDDSRRIRPGDAFVAVRGITSDGHAHLAAAVAGGAVVLVVEQVEPTLAVPQVVVRSGAEALGVLVANHSGSPSKQLRLVGITGTNGKTTTSYVVEQMLLAAKRAPGLIGTVAYRFGGKTIDAPYTTPTPHVLHQTFHAMVDSGVTDAVMEVSSAALSMGRLAAVEFKVAGFSNLTQDHLDVHGDMDTYRAAKQRLFAEYLAVDGVAVINIDDEAGESMAASALKRGCQVLRVSATLGGNADVQVVMLSSTMRGISATIRTPRGELSVASGALIGAYNVANLALAIGIGCALGLSGQAIVDGIAALPGVPGRVERVDNPAGLDIVVDYAHTPDALSNVLAALRPLVAPGHGRLICVFGCGGDRDPGKRPLMGAAVAELADLVVVTSDNPRTETPLAIIDAILPAVPSPFFVHVDRRVAIRAAIAEATPGDIVVIAGKGHEDYQILGTTKHHFDDREEAAAAVALRPAWSARELAAELGAKLDGDADVTRIIIDSRRAAPGDLYVAIRGEAHDGHKFCGHAVAAGATALLIEGDSHSDVMTTFAPDARPAIISIEAGANGAAAGRTALGELGRMVRRQWAKQAEIAPKLIAITGSSGKTTTKDLTRAALSTSGATHGADGSLNNETGVPMTLVGLRAHHRFAVIEMGMRGPGQIEDLTRFAEPDIAAVVNAGVAHIELLGSTDAIAAAKSEIWLGLATGGVAIFPVDDDRLAKAAKHNAPHARVLTFGDATGADVRLTGYRALGSAGAALTLEVQGTARELALPLLGRHAAIDATCALACALAAGVSVDAALDGLRRAQPPSMRAEVVDVAGRHVIVDCYNANPASMTAAIEMLGELSAGAHGLAIVGDMLELGSHAEAAHAAVGADLAARGLPTIALGEWKHVVAAAHGEVLATDDPAVAAAHAFATTQPGDFILLKASRGMRLERVLTALRSVANASPASTAS